MSSAQRQLREPEPAAGRSSSIDESVERALDWLRREWRAGFSAEMAYKTAVAAVHSLHKGAATQQATALLEEIERRLGAYRGLSVEQRKVELQEVAGLLNAVRPHLRLAEAPAVPVGKLPSAVVPVKRPRVAPAADEVRPPVRALSLEAAVTELPRVGTSVAKKLGNLGVKTVGDALKLGPRRHIDYSRTERIGAVLGFRHGEEVTVRGEVIDLKEIRGPGPPRVVIKLADESGWIKVTWFNKYIAQQLVVGDEIAVSGKLDFGYGPPSFTSPEWEKAGGSALSTGRLIPVYPLTEGLGQKTVRALTRAALDATRGTIEDHLPPAVRETHGLVDLVAAYEQLHYPDSLDDLRRSQRRLAFDDLFLLQLGLIRRKRQRQAEDGIPLALDRKLLDRFYRGLPFRLTHAQRHALGEIMRDLTQPKPMMRLLQGDVGSGKTVVAAAALLAAVANGLQAAVMAPTEILAEQHYHNLRGLFSQLSDVDRPTVALLTGSTRVGERRKTVAAVAAGEIDVLVGTHALIQEAVTFARLGLSVVDEQHRFGVRQRAHLPDKATGAQPHALMMTATPIPRTLNMVINGDLDVSVIGELPPGRIPIETRRYVGVEREQAYDVVRSEVAKGYQVFVICPLVEESEAIEAKAAVAEAQRLKQDVFPELRIATLHGRMSGKEKDAIMTAFRDRGYDLLVSTSVIEVGIDVPNATAMLVEGADRFGLAQLHQFRGRVGRGGARSYCLLLADETTPDGEARLEMLVATTDGFLLAEKDLELRGPGDFIGTRQSGLPEMAWLEGSFDTRLLDEARQSAETLLAADPDLRTPDHAPLRAHLQLFWAKASPDVPL